MLNKLEFGLKFAQYGIEVDSDKVIEILFSDDDDLDGNRRKICTESDMFGYLDSHIGSFDQSSGLGTSVHHIDCTDQLFSWGQYKQERRVARKARRAKRAHALAVFLNNPNGSQHVSQCSKVADDHYQAMAAEVNSFIADDDFRSFHNSVGSD